jgi:DNA-binding LytR/AlgR family response regulator/type IV secretory pathway VirB2 component (pilin)
VNSRPLQLALREMQGVFTSRISRFALVIAIVVLAVSGPFGTFESFNLGQQLVYWAVMVLLSYLVGQGLFGLLADTLRPLIAQRWPRLVVAAMLTAVPVAAIVFAVNSVAYQHLAWSSLLPIWLYTTLVTLVICIAVATLREQLRQAGATVVPAALATATPAPPPILERVPLPQRGRLIALSVEDHYVDIITERGKTLVLMRLADAMRETGTVAGLQIHHSHWVARDAVVKAHRSEGKLQLELSDGTRLPVSRGFLAQVREAGLA